MFPLSFTEFFQVVAQSDPIKYSNLPQAIYEALAPHGPALSTVRSWFNNTGNITLASFPDVVHIMLRRGYDLSSLRNYLSQLFEMRPRPRRSVSRLQDAIIIHLGRIRQYEINSLDDPTRRDLGLIQQMANDLIALGDIGRDLQQHVIEATRQHNPEEIDQIFQNLDELTRGEL